MNHEDLVGKYVSAADRRDVTVTPATNTPNDDHGHGTCCAGIAAAQSDNNIGVAGVAWNCRIMPIRLMINFRIDTESWIADAVNWARTHGANVISMSIKWVGPHSNTDLALTAAHGGNIVLVAGSGNDNYSSISYPASHPSVIAVGATDRNDQRKRPPGGIYPSSPDRECWGSNYGRGLSVMAPGVLCLTTDLTGNLGFNSNNGGGIYDILR